MIIAFILILITSITPDKPPTLEKPLMNLSEIKNPDLKKCVEENHNQTINENKDYKTGTILIGFKENTTKSEINTLLNHPEILTYSPKIYFEGTWNIKTKQGYEQLVIYKIKENPKIEFITLKYLQTITGF